MSYLGLSYSHLRVAVFFVVLGVRQGRTRRVKTPGTRQFMHNGWQVNPMGQDGCIGRTSTLERHCTHYELCTLDFSLTPQHAGA